MLLETKQQRACRAPAPACLCPRPTSTDKRSPPPPHKPFAGHGGVVKVGDLGMSRYAAQWRRDEGEGMLERTLTPGG